LLGLENPVSQTSTLFGFEDDFAATLEFIPMLMRFNLDRIGIKLSLQHWSRFTLAERQQLLRLPCDSPAQTLAYRDHLTDLMHARGCAPPESFAPDAQPAWSEAGLLPAQVPELARAMNLPVPTVAGWTRLPPLQRYALLKLSRPGHDHRNFPLALREFGLAPMS
jgi:hypothetical protein